jgi:hypothetical protein
MDAPGAFETATIKKIAWRILPLILVAYCVAYIDRANIAVAALTMNKDLGSAPSPMASEPAYSSLGTSSSRFQAT